MWSFLSSAIIWTIDIQNDKHEVVAWRSGKLLRLCLVFWISVDFEYKYKRYLMWFVFCFCSYHCLNTNKHKQRLKQTNQNPLECVLFCFNLYNSIGSTINVFKSVFLLIQYSSVSTHKIKMKCALLLFSFLLVFV